VVLQLIRYQQLEEFGIFRSASGKFTLRNRYENYLATGGKWAGMEAYGYATFAFGDNQAHNNIQPYIATYIWKRVK